MTVRARARIWLDGVGRLVDRLLDPSRRERNVAALLCVYTLVWTLYGILSKSAQDIHFDMAEVAGWARDLSLGYPKHPPLAAFVAWLWFSVFPQADWSFNLLAVAVAAVTLWIAWRIAGDYLDAEKRVAALALLTLVPFFNFHALKFNVNTVLLPVWAAAAWFFLRSYETRRPLYAALAGAFAALALLGKYWSVFLLLGLGLAALLDRRRAAYFRSTAPWITIAVGLAVLGPHLVWLMSHDFAPFSYAVGVHGASSAWVSIRGALEYLGGAAAYAALPVALVVLAARPDRATIADMLRPADDARRLVAFSFWGPLLIPVVLAPVSGLVLTSLWTMSAWALLPVVLLSSPRITLPRDALVRLVALALIFPPVMVAVSPAISMVVHRTGVRPSAEAHAQLLAAEVSRVWRATTERPLRLIGGDGDLAYGAAFYLPDRPSVFPYLSKREAPWVDDARIAREGIAMVCAAGNASCVETIEARARSGPKGQRAEVTLSRSYLGVAGRPERYLILTMPPQPG